MWTRQILLLCLCTVMLSHVIIGVSSQEKIHSGNLCTVLCSQASSSVSKTIGELSSAEHEQTMLYEHVNKHKAEMELLKDTLYNNTVELTIIRSYLNEILHQHKNGPIPSGDLKITARTGLTSGGRSAQINTGQRAYVYPMSTKSNMENSVEQEVPEVTPTESSEMNIPDWNPPNKKVILTVPTDCEEVRQSLGRYYVGRYYTQINPVQSLYGGDSNAFLAGCELREDAGWTLIQKRFDGAVSFDRTWDEYKAGFGNVEGEFWLGNDRIHHLTRQKNYRLRVELQTGSGRKFYAEYANFKVADEADNYRLSVSGYLGGSAGDALTGILSHNNSQFTTHDRDNDKYEAGNCATQYHGGWWFHSCFVAFLNGVIGNSQSAPTSFTTRDASSWHSRKVRSFYVPAMMQDGIVWRTINKRQTRDSAYYDDISIKMAVMMIAPRL